ncbi:MAG: hypothetical protein CVU65_03370 [Deltaproteobacteria bacterium HGW-Deltaproteobacteria-22]|jgi:hypothetical protein|nr:MAG: hypothetical protein CVU65_03370 [Deltaproteobacteria bacterium HGW-Deltaproteobacteria-22]
MTHFNNPSDVNGIGKESAMRTGMNRRMMSWVLGGLLAGSVAMVGAGCGREKSGASEPGTLPRPPEGGAAVGPGADVVRGASGIRGTVAGTGLVVKDAVFVWMDKADDMTLILSDRPGLCPLLVSGAMPKDSTVLMIMFKHNTPENRDAPFAPGTYPLRMPGLEKAAQDLKRVQLLKLDGTCESTLAREESRAVAGEVVLDSISAQKDGTAAGRLKLTFGEKQETLEGSFTAVFCAMPEDATEPRDCR